MIGRIFAIGLVLMLAACAFEPEFIMGNRISGDADAVVVKASYADPGPKAAEHCARYEKSPEFEKVVGTWWRWVGGSNEYLYKCK